VNIQLPESTLKLKRKVINKSVSHGDFDTRRDGTANVTDESLGIGYNNILNMEINDGANNRGDSTPSHNDYPSAAYTNKSNAFIKSRFEDMSQTKIQIIKVSKLDNNKTLNQTSASRSVKNDKAEQSNPASSNGSGRRGRRIVPMK
jgi:hypothetical protein